MESQSQPLEASPEEPSLEDTGTRYEHLKEYKESIDICIEMLKERDRSVFAESKIAKLAIASEVLQATLDAFAGYKESSSEYSLYKLINSVPKTKEELKSIGGTPLD